MGKIDFIVFQQINGLAGQWAWLDYAGIFLASYFQYFVMGALLIFLFAGQDKKAKRENVIMVSLSLLAIVISRLGITAFLHQIFMRPRPFVVNAVTQLIPYSAEASSFPSGHAAFFFALASAVYFHNKKAGIYFLIAASFICLSRVFVGVHYLSDILAGALIGLFSGWLVWRLYDFYQNKKAL